jgi:hypothetical protein
MDRTTEVKGGIFRRKFAGQDEIPVFEAAGLAKAHGTDISTTIAFDAFIELTQPVI